MCSDSKNKTAVGCCWGQGRALFYPHSITPTLTQLPAVCIEYFTVFKGEKLAATGFLPCPATGSRQAAAQPVPPRPSPKPRAHPPRGRLPRSPSRQGEAGRTSPGPVALLRTGGPLRLRDHSPQLSRRGPGGGDTRIEGDGPPQQPPAGPPG